MSNRANRRTRDKVVNENADWHLLLIVNYLWDSEHPIEIAGISGKVTLDSCNSLTDKESVMQLSEQFA